MIHIRIQQRNGRKTLTSVQGLSEEYDLNHGLKYTLHVLWFFTKNSPVYFVKEKSSKCVSVTLLVTVLLSNILNMVKSSSFKVRPCYYYSCLKNILGDQRDNISRFLREVKLARPEQIKIHGF